MHVRVSRVGEVQIGQFDLAMVALDCCGDHPFAEVLSLNDLSFPSLVQEYTNSMFFSDHTCTHVYGHILSFVLVSLFRTEDWRPSCNLRVLCEAHRIDLRHSSILRFLHYVNNVGGWSCRRCGVSCSCIVLVEVEGSIMSGCDHDHALY